MLIHSHRCLMIDLAVSSLQTSDHPFASNANFEKRNAIHKWREKTLYTLAIFSLRHLHGLLHKKRETRDSAKENYN